MQQHAQLRSRQRTALDARRRLAAERACGVERTVGQGNLEREEPAATGDDVRGSPQLLVIGQQPAQVGRNAFQRRPGGREPSQLAPTQAPQLRPSAQAEPGPRPAPSTHLRSVDLSRRSRGR